MLPAKSRFGKLLEQTSKLIDLLEWVNGPFLRKCKNKTDAVKISKAKALINKSENTSQDNAITKSILKQKLK